MNTLETSIITLAICFSLSGQVQAGHDALGFQGVFQTAPNSDGCRAFGTLHQNVGEPGSLALSINCGDGLNWTGIRDNVKFVIRKNRRGKMFSRVRTVVVVEQGTVFEVPVNIVLIGNARKNQRSVSGEVQTDKQPARVFGRITFNEKNLMRTRPRATGELLMGSVAH